MSNALVKQSLSLFDDREMFSSEKEKGPKQKGYKDPMKMISTKRKGVKKELRRIQRQQKQLPKKDNKKPSALEQYWNQQPEDHTEASIQVLEKISTFTRADSSVSKYIINHNDEKSRYKRRKQKTKKTEVEEKPATESSLFTEEDFEKFAKEYEFK